MSKSFICLFATTILLHLTFFPALAGNNAGQAFSLWPDTGQTTCYDDAGNVLNPCPNPSQPFYGQDAQYNGPTRSYTKLDASGNALSDSAPSWIMVSDKVTGLIWEVKEAMDNVVNYANPHDADNTYTWCDTNPDSNGGHQGTCGSNDTEDFIAALNSNPGFGGHTDWRLPTIKELKTLVDRSSSDPAINTIYFPNTVARWYWSSTTRVTYTDYARQVFFTFGMEDNNYKSGGNNVRAVRGGLVQPQNSFVINPSGVTVTDTVTCLEWQRATADITGDGVPDPMSWQDALSYAEELSLDGHSDWRLPDSNELASIVDYTQYSPTIDLATFPDSVSSPYWTSTTLAPNTGMAWVMNNSFGFDSYSGKSSSYYVRTVRNCGSSFPWPMFLPAITNAKK
ncbi:MAG: DUF1566 domain-containing protein [Proteobacteria bacterium]|nr:DUF1566 domain-containing protein [Pseudomonadota bacterium]